MGLYLTSISTKLCDLSDGNLPGGSIQTLFVLAFFTICTSIDLLLPFTMLFSWVADVTNILQVGQSSSARQSLACSSKLSLLPSFGLSHLLSLSISLLLSLSLSLTLAFRSVNLPAPGNLQLNPYQNFHCYFHLTQFQVVQSSCAKPYPSAPL